MFEWFGLVNYCPATKVTDFAQYLRDGELMASRCTDCGYQSFPPRADCPECRSESFAFTEITGEGTVHTFTRIEAAPAGFEDHVPFTIGVVDLKEGGRLLAWFGETISEEEIAIDMPVQVVPRVFDEIESIKVHYTLEAPGDDLGEGENGVVMGDDGGCVRSETRCGVRYLTLANPPVNILTARLMNALSDALEETAADTTLVAVAVTAEGKAFSAGADVGEHAPEQAPEMIDAFSRMFRLLGALEIPVVMAVDGAALGAGFELIMMADVLLATERAKFGQPEIRLGFFAPVGVAYLPALVGPAKAMEITCGGGTYSAHDMAACGLVSAVVPSDALADTLEKVLDDFRKASPLVMRMNVRMLKRLRGRPFEEARVEAEKVFLEELMATEDVREGIASFIEKRLPQWKNR